MDKKRSKILCVLLSIAMLTSIMTVSVNAATGSFTDVPSDAWFAAPVAKAIQNGYISGMGDGRFAPYDDLTYAQVFSMVVNAEYKNDEGSFEFSNKATMDASFGGSTPWWGYYAYFLNAKGLLKGTAADNNVTVRGVVESKVTRYAMVQIVYNVLKDKGVNVAQSTIDNAKNAITDWSKVPASFQTAVAVGYNLGIISGFEDGSFGGMGILTRAQSCVIINKTLDVIKNGGSSGGGTTTPPVEPPVAPPTTGEKQITVTNNGGAYTVIDNGFSTGTLNNGLPITEENVIALLKKAEAEFPTGTTWAYSGTPNNNWYMGTGSVVGGVMSGTVNSNYACGGFVAMISDYLFGKNSNPAKQVTDMSKIRAGDIIIQWTNNGTFQHVMIATTSVIKDGIYAGRVWTADGNSSSQINWPGQWDIPWSEAQISGYWTVYTRYPDGNGTTDPGTEPEPPANPKPGTETNIIVSTRAAGNGTAHYVGDNQFPTGTLNNGLPITEENVIALLKKAESIWPTEMRWTNSGSDNNNWYMEVGTVTNGVIMGQYSVSASYACGGFAAMISDYVFGKTSNPVHQTTIENIRPGDIIFIQNSNGTNKHICIATSGQIKDGIYAGRVPTADGNISSKVNWPSEWSMPRAVADGTYWVVYTRYPD